ncbi:MAG: carboxypeptidase-like regulatory domain-containing protein [Acidobacteria bacterium]|nr:carboxypeptidase-like regulatory domain-containing protein [Acidobacteriota bacterium]
MKLFFASALLLTMSMLFAQSDRGVVTGTVTDSTGALIPGVRIVLTNANTGANTDTVTTGTGNYTHSCDFRIFAVENRKCGAIDNHHGQANFRTADQFWYWRRGDTQSTFVCTDDARGNVQRLEQHFDQRRLE